MVAERDAKQVFGHRAGGVPGQRRRLRVRPDEHEPPRVQEDAAARPRLHLLREQQTEQPQLRFRGVQSIRGE